MGYIFGYGTSAIHGQIYILSTIFKESVSCKYYDIENTFHDEVDFNFDDLNGSDEIDYTFFADDTSTYNILTHIIITNINILSIQIRDDIEMKNIRNFKKVINFDSNTYELFGSVLIWRNDTDAHVISGIIENGNEYIYDSATSIINHDCKWSESIQNNINKGILIPELNTIYKIHILYYMQINK